MAAAWRIIRRYKFELLVIGLIRIVSGELAARRYVDRLDRRTEGRT